MFLIRSKDCYIICFHSQVDFVIGSFLPWSVEEQAKGFTGWSYDTFSQNIGPHYKDQTFWTVFSVFFPAVTGITAGANMSGDLEDPAMAIPKVIIISMIPSPFYCLLFYFREPSLPS